MQEIRILGLLITDRIKEAGQVQQVLSKHTNIIRSRLGFHELSTSACSRTGVILVQLSGKSQEWDVLEHDLAQLEGLEVQRISFNA
jgi:hypothetical protein